MLHTIWFEDGTSIEITSIQEWKDSRQDFVQIVKGEGMGHMGGSYYKMLDDGTIIDFGYAQLWKYVPADLGDGAEWVDATPEADIDPILHGYTEFKFGKWISGTDYNAIRDEAFS